MKEESLLLKQLSKRIRLYWFDKNKKVRWTRNLEKWGRWMEKSDRHVAETFYPEYRVSTVFLGLDHGFLPDRPPILFETMVFDIMNPEELKLIKDPKEKHYVYPDLYQERYATWEEAARGHRKICERIENGIFKGYETD